MPPVTLSRAELLRKLAEIGFDPTARGDMRHRALAHCAEYMGSAFAVLWLRDVRTGDLVPAATYGAPEGLTLGKVEADRLPEFEGNRALASGRPLLIGDLDAVCLPTGSVLLLRQLAERGVAVKSLAICPLVARGDARGLVTFCWTAPVRWNSDDEEFFHTVATVMAMVVENAALREELEGRVTELHALLEIAGSASSNLDMAAVFPLVLPKVRQLLEADEVGIALLTEDGKELVPTSYLEGYSRTVPRGQHEALRLSAKPWVQEALRIGGPVFIADYAADPKVGEVERQVFPTGSSAAVPLLAGSRSVGVMFVNWHRPRRTLDDTVMRLLGVVGRQLGRFVANAQVHASVQLQNRYLKAASNIALALASPRSLKDVLSEVCREIVQALDAALAEIFLLDGSGEYLEGAALYGPRVTQDDLRYFGREQHHISSALLISAVAREGKGVAIADGRQDARISAQWIERHRIGPVLFLPLKKVDGSCLGVMTLAKLAEQPLFAPLELEMAEGVARQVSVAIERTLLHEGQDRAVRTVAGLAWLNYWRAAEFDALIRNLTDGVIVVRNNGELHTVNKAAMEILGITEERAVVPTLQRLELFDLKGNPIHQGLDPLSRVLRGESFRNYVVSTRLSAGPRFFSFSGTTVPVGDARVGLAVVTFSEVTEQLRQDMARNEFVSDLFHDLVTPVTAIKLAAQNALKRIARGYSAEALVRNLETIVARSDEASRMLRLLIDVSKVEADAVRVFPEWFDLSSALKDWVQDMSVGWPDHLITGRIQDRVMVYADQEAVRRVVDNLVNNAARHSPKGSEISICLASDGQWAYMAVRDHGTGILPEHQVRVFERYFRLTTGGIGMGLGLYLSKKLLEAQGGEVWLVSLPGQGTTVFVSLPAST